MTKSQKILVGAAVAAVVIFSIMMMLSKKLTAQRPSPAPNIASTPSDGLIDVSKVVFDAKTTIPGTSVTFSYPKNGFHGNGLTLAKGDRSPLQVFPSVANYSVTSSWVGNRFTTNDGIYLNIYKLGSEKTLEDAMATTGGQMTDLPLGHYQDENGMRFFLVPSSDPRAVVSYTAYALIKRQLLAITFDGGFTVSDSGSAPDLVTLFLKHLDFTCASDCSVNSAPVVVENMPTDGQ